MQPYKLFQSVVCPSIFFNKCTIRGGGVGGVGGGGWGGGGGGGGGGAPLSNPRPQELNIICLTTIKPLLSTQNIKNLPPSTLISKFHIQKNRKNILAATQEYGTPITKEDIKTTQESLKTN